MPKTKPVTPSTFAKTPYISNRYKYDTNHSGATSGISKGFLAAGPATNRPCMVTEASETTGVDFIGFAPCCGKMITLKLSKEAVMSTINWITSFDEGLSAAKKSGKLIFADFFNPG